MNDGKAFVIISDTLSHDLVPRIHDMEKREIAMAFAESVLDDDTGVMAVIFIITINIDQVSTLTTPFAIIADYSDFPQEEEVLFSMHTVFRVSNIEQSVTYNHLWEVKLTLTDDNDPQLVDLTERMKEEIDGKGWNQMGKLMLKVGHFDQAEDNITCSLLECADTYVNLGETCHDMQDYNMALVYFRKGLYVREEKLSEDHDLAIVHHSLAKLYLSTGEYQLAMESVQQAITIGEKKLLSTHPDIVDYRETYETIRKKM
ncbi:hypothetical protein I4U23_016197 [Adineta vaga]|nr:hypothetical protein I4U23_016197 [Adineta vaga]